MNGLFNGAQFPALGLSPQNQNYNNMAGQLQGLQSLFASNRPAFLPAQGFQGGLGGPLNPNPFAGKGHPVYQNVLGQGQAGDMQGHAFGGRLDLHDQNDPRVAAARAAYAQKMGTGTL